jgi:hypothetical protein
MTVVAGVLLDHVHVDPAEADVLLHEAASVGQSANRAVLTGPVDLRSPRSHGVPQGCAVSQFETAVWAIRVGLRVVDGRHMFSSQDPAEPVPLHLRHVLNEPGQCEVRGWHGRGGGLLIIHALALHGQGDAVEVKPALERGALVYVQGGHNAFDSGHLADCPSRAGHVASELPEYDYGCLLV